MELLARVQAVGNRKFLIHTSLLNKIIKTNMEQIEWINNKLKQDIHDLYMNENNGIKSELELFELAYYALAKMNKQEKNILIEIINDKNYNDLIKNLYREITNENKNI